MAAKGPGSGAGGVEENEVERRRGEGRTGGIGHGRATRLQSGHQPGPAEMTVESAHPGCRQEPRQQRRLAPGRCAEVGDPRRTRRRCGRKVRDQLRARILGVGLPRHHAPDGVCGAVGLPPRPGAPRVRLVPRADRRPVRERIVAERPDPQPGRLLVGLESTLGRRRAELTRPARHQPLGVRPAVSRGARSQQHVELSRRPPEDCVDHPGGGGSTQPAHQVHRAVHRHRHRHSEEGAVVQPEAQRTADLRVEGGQRPPETRAQRPVEGSLPAQHSEHPGTDSRPRLVAEQPRRVRPALDPLQQTGRREAVS